MDNSIKEDWDKEYWDNYYKMINLRVASKNDPIRKLIEQYIPKQNGYCMEIGCYPGQYLPVFGELGYTLNGIDLAPGVDNVLPAWLKKMGYSIGNFYQENFTTFKTPNKYNLVCSFGFIEHFTNWESMIKYHAQLVDDGGYLIITTPNYAGSIQTLLHTHLNMANYKRHVTESMCPEEWKTLLENEKFQIIYYGYFGGFHFWINFNDKQNIIKKFIASIIYEVTNYVGFVFPNRRMYSPFCGVIAKKIDS